VLKFTSIRAVCRSIAGRLLAKKACGTIAAGPFCNAQTSCPSTPIGGIAASLTQAAGCQSENKYRNKDLEIQIPSAAGGSVIFPT